MATTKVGLYAHRVGRKTKWRVRWFGRYDPKTGKEKRYSKTFDRKADAQMFQKQKEKEFSGGVKRDPSQETLRGYCEHWLEFRIGFIGIKPATVESYRETFKRLYEFFGPDCLLRHIDKSDAKAFLSSLQPRQRHRVKPLSAWARHRILRECSCVFGTAVEEGILPKNPFKNKKAEKPKLPETEWYYLPPDGFRKVLDVTPTLREKAFYALCYTAGLRRSEALSLYWNNIVFDKGEVHIVNRDATDQHPPFAIKDCEKREIPVPAFMLDLLAELYGEAEDGVPFVLLDRKRADRIQAKWEWCQQQGKPWRNRYWSNNMLREYRRRIRQAGIETGNLDPTVHGLRKSCIQNWADCLPMNVVMEFAGHSDIATTEKFYNKTTDEHRKAAKERSQDLLTRDLTDLKLTISSDTGR